MSIAGPPDSESLLRRLRDKFREQASFAADYAPVSARVFATVAGWLEQGGPDPVASWLLETARELQPFAVTNLLLAGLHRDVLAGEPSASALSRFFPTAGGEPRAPALEPALRQAILGRSTELRRFLSAGRVQTNETSRGLAWLLPLHLTGWAAVHLVDLGASAGLNLLADKRHYRLLDHDSGALLCELGLGQPPQFITMLRSAPPEFCRQLSPLPALASRLGGDARPFHLRTPADELSLQAFVWPDHPDRLRRLQQGIATLRAHGELQLEELLLPDGLASFLARHVPSTAMPVVVYNTYMTPYLPDRGASLRDQLGEWAARQPRPVLWLQWEPPQQAEMAPAEGWCAWTADLWRGNASKRQLLGWIHPHGTAGILAPDFPNAGWFDTIA